MRLLRYRDLRLVLLPGVFAPRSDAGMLLDAAAGRFRGATVLDVCTGSGVLALSAARAGARATALDISRRALASVRLNALLNGLSVEALRGDLFAPVRGRRFDVIVSNPPYLPAPPGAPARGAARAWNAGPDGRLLLDRLCTEAPAHLRAGGRLVLVQSTLADVERTERRLGEAGLALERLACHEGPLGTLARSRAGYLRRLGVVDEALRETIVVICASLP